MAEGHQNPKDDNKDIENDGKESVKEILSLKQQFNRFFRNMSWLDTNLTDHFKMMSFLRKNFKDLIQATEDEQKQSVVSMHEVIKKVEAVQLEIDNLRSVNTPPATSTSINNAFQLIRIQMDLRNIKDMMNNCKKKLENTAAAIAWKDMPEKIKRKKSGGSKKKKKQQKSPAESPTKSNELQKKSTEGSPNIPPLGVPKDLQRKFKESPRDLQEKLTRESPKLSPKELQVDLSKLTPLQVELSKLSPLQVELSTSSPVLQSPKLQAESLKSTKWQDQFLKLSPKSQAGSPKLSPKSQAGSPKFSLKPSPKDRQMDFMRSQLGPSAYSQESQKTPEREFQEESQKDSRSHQEKSRRTPRTPERESQEELPKYSRSNQEKSRSKYVNKRPKDWPESSEGGVQKENVNKAKEFWKKKDDNARNQDNRR